MRVVLSGDLIAKRASTFVYTRFKKHAIQYIRILEYSTDEPKVNQASSMIQKRLMLRSMLIMDVTLFLSPFADDAK